MTEVDNYWSSHIVMRGFYQRKEKSRGAKEHKAALKKRIVQSPLAKEFLGLYGKHDNEVILDYGCGPGADVIGFALDTKAKKIIGVDISEKALNLTKYYLQLYKIDMNRIRLVCITDAISQVPLDDNTVDYIHCNGVIQHSSNPGAILMEFCRVLKSGGQGRIMVYNRDSIFFHLRVAYVRMLIKRCLPNMSIEEVFTKSTDGPDCPISVAYIPNDFVQMCDKMGFKTEYIGGACSPSDSKYFFDKYSKKALKDVRLSEEHKNFIRNVKFDKNNHPMFQGLNCGIYGVFKISKG